MTKILGENGDTFIKIVLFAVITNSVADPDITKSLVKKNSLIYLKKDFFLILQEQGRYIVYKWKFRIHFLVQLEVILLNTVLYRCHSRGTCPLGLKKGQFHAMYHGVLLTVLFSYTYFNYKFKSAVFVIIRKKTIN